MDIHPWTKYEVARVRDEERLLRARAAMRARELREPITGDDVGVEAGSSSPFGWLRRRRPVTDAHPARTRHA